MSSADLRPVVPRSLGQEAVERLRQAIRNGSLPSGTRLVERDLATRLGMSRIPIREAIQRLIDEGLVQKVPHRGTFVYVPAPAEIEEISSLRCVLERFVVERVMARWTPACEVDLYSIVEEMRRQAAVRDFQRLYEQDLAFHHVLWTVADHALLLEVVSGLRSRINRFLSEAAAAMPPAHLESYIALHTDLIAVLRSGDVHAAQQAITEHIQASKDRILAYYAAQAAAGLPPRAADVRADGYRAADSGVN